jgi:hypothetical protein
MDPDLLIAAYYPVIELNACSLSILYALHHCNCAPLPSDRTRRLNMLHRVLSKIAEDLIGSSAAFQIPKHDGGPPCFRIAARIVKPPHLARLHNPGHFTQNPAKGMSPFHTVKQGKRGLGLIYSIIHNHSAQDTPIWRLEVD